MDRFDRIFLLNKLLQNSRRPLSHKQLEERLECSRATVTRTIEDLRDFLNAPLEYDRQANGYFYNQQAGEIYELPGLWFNASELQALLGMQQLLAEVQPGLLDTHLAPLRRRIDQILASQQLGGDQLTQRIRILRTAAREPGEHFQTVAGALALRLRLHIDYQGRGRNQPTSRDISPQRLVHYRDNWYLDAWCHLRGALRSFALDAISAVRVLECKAKEVPNKELGEHFSSAYGIFGGRADRTAVVRFSPRCARWVACEQWHPRQQGQWLDDGRYQLSIPYHDARELIMDILRYGPEAEVISPPSLRRQVGLQLQQAADQYQA